MMHIRAPVLLLVIVPIAIIVVSIKAIIGSLTGLQKIIFTGQYPIQVLEIALIGH
jgi:hypothetical protein